MLLPVEETSAKEKLGTKAIFFSLELIFSILACTELCF